LQAGGPGTARCGYGKLTAAADAAASIEMSGHFSAFSFVDRITQLDPGKRAAGIFRVPAHLSDFSSCLATEAAGQLAAWVAMAELDFELRPVAGVAADLHFGAEPRPGQTLDLTVDIDGCDKEVVTYSASAYADGVKVIELEHSTGPMLPMDTFDAPEAVRARFEVLCADGAPGGVFGGVPPHKMQMIDEVPGERARVQLQVPREAAFFSDHFPRRPVFPGTMLLDAHIQMSLDAAARSGYFAPGVKLAAVRVPNLKLRTFIAPGDVVELRVEFAPPGDAGVLSMKTSAYMNGKQIALGGLDIAPADRRS
jgi:3-hydroxyacyl-[acyl-carrier-protein] dehydratase